MSAARVAHRDVPTRFATRVYLAEITSAGDNRWPRRELQPKPPLDASINTEKPVDRWRTGRARGGARGLPVYRAAAAAIRGESRQFRDGLPQLSACCDARGGRCRSPVPDARIARSTRRRRALQTAAMQHRISAGAIVEDAAGQILLVRHVLPGKYDFWVAPGGGVQGREELAAAAIREVREETGLHVASRLARVHRGVRQPRHSAREILVHGSPRRRIAIRRRAGSKGRAHRRSRVGVAFGPRRTNRLSVGAYGSVLGRPRRAVHSPDLSRVLTERWSSGEPRRVLPRRV